MRSVNNEGKLLAISVTPGNVNDRKGLLTTISVSCGNICDGKYCIAKEFSQKMRHKSVEIITQVHKNI